MYNFTIKRDKVSKQMMKKFVKTLNKRVFSKVLKEDENTDDQSILKEGYALIMDETELRDSNEGASDEVEEFNIEDFSNEDISEDFDLWAEAFMNEDKYYFEDSEEQEEDIFEQYIGGIDNLEVIAREIITEAMKGTLKRSKEKRGSAKVEKAKAMLRAVENFKKMEYVYRLLQDDLNDDPYMVEIFFNDLNNMLKNPEKYGENNELIGAFERVKEKFNKALAAAIRGAVGAERNKAAKKEINNSSLWGRSIWELTKGFYVESDIIAWDNLMGFVNYRLMKEGYNDQELKKMIDKDNQYRYLRDYWKGIMVWDTDTLRIRLEDGRLLTPQSTKRVRTRKTKKVSSFRLSLLGLMGRSALDYGVIDQKTNNAFWKMAEFFDWNNKMTRLQAPKVNWSLSNLVLGFAGTFLPDFIDQFVAKFFDILLTERVRLNNMGSWLSDRKLVESVNSALGQGEAITEMITPILRKSMTGGALEVPIDGEKATKVLTSSSGYSYQWKNFTKLVRLMLRGDGYEKESQRYKHLIGVRFKKLETNLNSAINEVLSLWTSLEGYRGVWYLDKADFYKGFPWQGMQKGYYTGLLIESPKKLYESLFKALSLSFRDEFKKQVETNQKLNNKQKRGLLNTIEGIILKALDDIVLDKPILLFDSIDIDLYLEDEYKFCLFDVILRAVQGKGINEILNGVVSEMIKEGKKMLLELGSDIDVIDWGFVRDLLNTQKCQIKNRKKEPMMAVLPSVAAVDKKIFKLWGLLVPYNPDGLSEKHNLVVNDESNTIYRPKTAELIDMALREGVIESKLAIRYNSLVKKLGSLGIGRTKDTSLSNIAIDKGFIGLVMGLANHSLSEDKFLSIVKGGGMSLLSASGWVMADKIANPEEGIYEGLTFSFPLQYIYESNTYSMFGIPSASKLTGEGSIEGEGSTYISPSGKVKATGKTTGIKVKRAKVKNKKNRDLFTSVDMDLSDEDIYKIEESIEELIDIFG